MAFGGLGTLFTLAGGVLVPIELSAAAEESASMRHAVRAAKPLFVQISDTRSSTIAALPQSPICRSGR